MANRMRLKTLFELGLAVGASAGGSTVTVSLRSGMASRSELFHATISLRLHARRLLFGEGSTYRT